MLGPEAKQLGLKVKEEEVITASAKAAGNEAATWAAKCAEQKQKIPYVLCAIRYLSRSKLPLLSKCNSKRISNLNLNSAPYSCRHEVQEQ